MKNRFLSTTRLGWVGFILSLGLVTIALIVDLIDNGGFSGVSSIIQVYKQNPVQWIVLTSPAFLTSVFHFLGKMVSARELKLKQRAQYEEQQFHLLERFVEELEEGNLNITLSESFGNRSLGDRLEQFRNKLITNRDEEQRRIWEKEGLAAFSDLIRQSQNIENLCDDAMKFLVKHVGCNQGSIFIAVDADGDTQLDQIACYAYQRKKYQKQTIAAGDGLVGQCYLEKETIILFEVPNDYIRITSGLGEAVPSFIAIVPMKSNESVYGILEVAAFRKLERYQISFLEKAADALATVINSAKTAANVERLLRESQFQTEQLRAQEEEMRQNVEELHAVQEQMTRELNEYKNRNSGLEEKIQLLNNKETLLATWSKN